MNILTIRTSLLVAFMVCTFPAFAQDAPEISFDKEVIDFGTIKKGSDGTRYFIVKNKSKSETLIIKNAVGSCGCTVPTYPKGPILPGKEAKIKVQYDTQRVGAFKKSVTVYSNAKDSQKVLYIKGEVSED